MSSDKDKRSSKLFGSRISSIFNVQQGHNVKPGHNDNYGSSTLRSVPIKPLSQPPLNNNPGRSTLDPNKPARSGYVPPQTHIPHVPHVPIKSPPRRKPPPPLMDEFEHRSDNNRVVEPSVNNRAVEPFNHRTVEPLNNLTVEPPVNNLAVDSFNNRTVEPSISQRSMGSANKYGEEVKEDLNNIIGTLEKEIGSMLVTNEPTTHMYQEDYLPIDDDQTSMISGLHVSNPLNPSKSNQSGATYYSDCSPSLIESEKSTSISQCASDTREESLEDTSTPSFTPSDTPEYNHAFDDDQTPYPIESLPESPTFEGNAAGLNSVLDSGFPHIVSNDSRTSINSSVYSQGDAEPSTRLKSFDTFGSNQSIPSQRKKEYQTATSLNNTMNTTPSARTPQTSSFIRGMQQTRNPFTPVPIDSGSHASNSRSKPPSRQNVSHHRKSSSVSSLWSANSYRSVNMSKLKKSLDLKPGEGERSNYVMSIRRNAGTAFNESPPGKWKLPIGILPVDNRAGYTANGRYLRLAGGVQGRNKKTSGVELKHGHLQPRLLAAEVDDGDESPVGLQSLGRSGTDLTIATNKSLVSGVKSSGSSINVTPSGSLLRNSSYGKTLDDSQSINTGGDSSSTLPSSRRAESVSSSSSSRSSSSNSITDFNIGIGGYYQHPGYLHNDDEETSTEFETDLMGEGGRNRNNDYKDYDTKPRLVLANPDNSEDSD